MPSGISSAASASMNVMCCPSPADAAHSRPA
jgi:hypothetical protein